MSTKTSKGAKAKPATSALNPTFKLIAIVNGIICAACFSVLVFIGLKEQPSEHANQLFEVCKIVFCTTTGAFSGLLGGKVSGPDPNGSPVV